MFQPSSPLRRCPFASRATPLPARAPGLRPSTLAVAATRGRRAAGVHVGRTARIARAGIAAAWLAAAAPIAIGLAHAADTPDADRVVPAHEEPRHVPKLVNDWVRVIDVEIPEGAQTMLHRHALDYPYLMVTAVTLDNEVLGQAPKPVKIEAGAVGYYRATTQGAYTHRFINRGPGTFRAIGIELLREAEHGARAPLPDVRDSAQLATVIDNERVRAWRIRLAPGESTPPLPLPGPGLRIGLTDGSLVERDAGGAERAWTATPAGFVFRAAPVTATLVNRGDSPVEWVEFGFK
ncbi:MAG: hypothetical protein MUF30_11720 [Burkholderiales bacterium]|nr:hypothetical protein [Burkholderiales bacterium]